MSKTRILPDSFSIHGMEAFLRLIQLLTVFSKDKKIPSLKETFKENNKLVIDPETHTIVLSP